MPVTSGTRLGPYEVLSLLGAGGMGEVYRARDSQLRRDVAIKVLANLTSDPDRLRRFEQEARAAAALNHPNILAVYQMGTYDGAPYLVSELLEGETLREQIKRSRLPVRKAIDFGAQIARGLAAAHEKGIVHRDLKPENLFISRDGRVKILDFGLAKLTEPRETPQFGVSTVTDGTDPGTVLGTVGYMSPEQVRGERADHRADIFAFGGILYEMLAGSRAFQKPTLAETMAAILNDDPPGISQLTPNIPPALQRVVHRCLEKKLEARFQSASDLAFALEALSGSEVVSATHSAPKQSSRTRVGWIVAGGIALLAAAFFAWQRLPVSVPQIEAIAQLTNDGEPKSTDSALVTDGSRIYFNELLGGSWRMAQVSTAGGQTAVFPSVIERVTMDLAPDASGLLALSVAPTTGPLWFVPLPIGEARQLGDLQGQTASFLPDGRVVFANGGLVYVAHKDGSSAHKLLDSPGLVYSLNPSSDGKSVGFTELRSNGTSSSLWEMTSDGTNVRELLKGWHTPPEECCGKWTPDGKYFVFEHHTDGRSDLWTLRASRGLSRSSSPWRLTNGPLSYSLPAPSRDGRQIFAVGTMRRGELVRYDTNTKQFVPYLSGISAIDATASQDGQWIAYLSYPDHAVWRSRADGSDPLQLTYAPMNVYWPRISPDGGKVAFTSHNASGGYVVYVVKTAGGPPRKIAENARNPAWSPDSASLVAIVSGKAWWIDDYKGLETIDLDTGKTSPVPESQAKGGTFWPQPNMLVAPTLEGGARFVLFDFKTQKWSDLIRGSFADWMQSVDGKYLYATTRDPGDARVLRIRLTDHHVDTILSLSRFRQIVDEDTATWVGVTPDGSVLLTRDVGTQEIYALNMKWP